MNTCAWSVWCSHINRLVQRYRARCASGRYSLMSTVPRFSCMPFTPVGTLVTPKATAIGVRYLNDAFRQVRSPQYELPPLQASSFPCFGAYWMKSAQQQRQSLSCEVPGDTVFHQTGSAEGVTQPVALNCEQETVLRLVMDGASVYVGGGAGTGKSFLIREMVSHLRDLGLCVAVTASTGIASLNIEGHTFHSTFGISCRDGASDGKWTSHFHTSLSAVQQRETTRMASVLAAFDVVVIDEISLLSAEMIELLEGAARQAHGKNAIKPFGGMQVIMSGDFLQLAAVGTDSLRELLPASHLANDRIVCTGIVDFPGEANTNVLNTFPVRRGIRCNDAIGRQSSLDSRLRHDPGYCGRVAAYQSPVFRHHLLHLQLKEPARHGKDSAFLRDLNLLRRGVLTYRLSRSSVLNPADPTAIRLYARKRSVVSYNLFKMSELKGKTIEFPTRIRMKGSNFSGFDCPDSRVFFSDTVVLCILHTCPRAVRSSLNRVIPSILRELFSDPNSTPVSAVSSRVAPPAYLSAVVLPCRNSHPVFSLAVRCKGQTLNEARSRLSRLLEMVRHWRARHSLKGEYSAERSGGWSSRPQFLSAPECSLLEFYCCTADQLARFVEAQYTPKITREVQRDFALQTKRLKVGCRVILLRNLSSKYVNGSVGTIVGFSRMQQCVHLLPVHLKGRPYVYGARRSHMAKVQEGQAYSLDGDESLHMGLVPIVRMDSDNADVAIPWVVALLPKTVCCEFFHVEVMCLPLAPAYAFTVHKIQGVTLDHPVLFDAVSMFSCDHLVYVAVSRVKTFSQIRIINLSPRMISVHRPSLDFSDSLPDVCEAERTWRRWRATTLSQPTGCRKPRSSVGSESHGLFRASWTERP